MIDLLQTDDEIRDLMRDFLGSYARNHPVRSVAVIGNAPLEPSAERAEQIDSADLVFRVNSFVVDQPGDEPCLGREVDVILLNRGTRATPWMLERYPRKAYMQSDTAMVHVQSVRYRTPGHWPADLGMWQVPNRALTEELRQLIWPGYEGFRVDPSTGTLAAWLGYRLFPDAELRLTGFSFLGGERHLSWKHHRGGEVRVPINHRVDREGHLLSSWIASGRAVALP